MVYISLDKFSLTLQLWPGRLLQAWQVLRSQASTAMRLQAQDHLFVVGTEEGHIHKCSQAYNSEYLQTYQGDLLLPDLALQG